SQRNNAQSDVLNSKLVNHARTELSEMLTELGTSEQGLSAVQVLARRGQYGLNQIEQEHAIHWWWHLWLSYNNPFSLLLTLLAAVSFLTKDMQGAAVISVMVVMATLIRFFQEHRSNLAARALKELVSNTISVRRCSDGITTSTGCYDLDDT